MGTRALTIVKDENHEYLHLMRQSDGYIDCHGKALAKFLDGKVWTDGFRSEDRAGLFNGVDCLSAQIVAHFKTSPGRFYLGSKESTAEWGSPDYAYRVYLDGEKAIEIEVERYGDIVFKGSPSDLLTFEEPEE